jgi:hypothetical protein
MARMSHYEFDFFVSYAHVDNEPIYPAEIGWVSVLIENLRRFLEKQLGRRGTASNWYADHSLHGNHPIRDHIPEQAKRSAMFLAVLSPGYVSSEFCLRELEAFIESHREDLAERLFVIEHLPLDEHHKIPEPFIDLRKYRFYKLDDKQVPRPFALPRPLPDEREYFQKVDDLARDIARKLTTVKASTKSRPAVFLAEVTDDLESRRDEVRRYLNQADIDVFPDTSYRLVREEFERALAADLSKCAVFVQLLGAVVGKRPPDVPNGFGWLQHELAKRAKVPILQWRSPDIDLSKIDLQLHRRLLELETVKAMPIEDFKFDIVQSLRSLAERPAPGQQFMTNPSVVFINADPVDRESADLIKNSLRDRVGWAMPLSLFDRTAQPEELQQDMETNLINSDGLMIVYGAARPAWVTNQLQLYRKLAPRRTKSPRLLAIIEAPPQPKAPISIGLPGLLTMNIGLVDDAISSAFLQ